MLITMYGACKEVGRSGLLIEEDNKRVVCDYGVLIETDGLYYPLPIDTKVHSIILSHAHLDHSGALPKVFLNNMPKVYMTPPTQALSDLLIDDAFKVAKRKKRKLPFEKKHFKYLIDNTRIIPYNKRQEIEGFEIEFYNAGHIPGSAMTLIEGKRTVCYSGDFKTEETRLHNPADVPNKKVDALIIETTYGGRDHPDRKELENSFYDACLEVLTKGGNVIVPVFAVGRAQEILEILRDIGYPIYMDGMAVHATEIILDYPEYIKNYKELYKATTNAIMVRNPKIRKQVMKEPSIVITTGGMLQGGPVIEYLYQAVKRPKDTAIFLTGFQKEDTPGRELMLYKTATIEGETLDFRKHWVEYFDFSAHVGRDGLEKTVKKMDPNVVILNHGDLDQMLAFAEWLSDQGYNYVIPDAGQTIDVDKYC